MDKNIIYYGECEHLVGDLMHESCLKRYVSFFNLSTSKFETLAICNKYLSLLIQKKIQEKSYYDKHDAFVLVLSDIISKFVPEQLKTNKHKNSRSYLFSNTKESKDILTLSIKEQVCFNPIIFYDINIIDAINYDLNSNSYIFRDNIFATLKQFIEYRKEKMYKTKYKEIIRLLNKHYSCYSDEERLLIMNEIFINILKLNNYETSKQ